MKQTALVLEHTRNLSIREIEIGETLGPRDVRVDIHTVGVCGSDVHYYQHGAIGPFVVNAPMILGHEAAGTVTQIGPEVTHLKVGDRVCMEPGIPDADSRPTRLGMYNLDPAVRFWATPPVHGCLRSSVIHPAAFTFKLPDPVGFDEGAMVEPLAVGMHAVNKAKIKPGDVAVVMGAGPIGTLTAMAAIAGGCSKVYISDIQEPKLEIARSVGKGSIVPIHVAKTDIVQFIQQETEAWGVDVVFDAVGLPHTLNQSLELVCPGGCVVLIGMPGKPVQFDVVAAQIKEVRIESIFRYAHVFSKAIALMASRKIDVRPLITDTFSFKDSIQAFDYACNMRPESVKVQIKLKD